MATDTVESRNLDQDVPPETESCSTPAATEELTRDNGIWYIARLERTQVQRGETNFERKG